jgi:hypothetical protein
MAYDKSVSGIALFRKLAADTAKHRVPDEEEQQDGMFLMSLWVAGKLLNADSPHGYRLAVELERARNFYYKVCLDQLRRRKRGRPQHMADIAFIYAMARTWEGIFERPKFRKYQNARIKKHEIGGTEQPTTFQQVCNKWMEFIDPDRPRPLTAAAFKDASKHYKRLRHRQ